MSLASSLLVVSAGALAVNLLLTPAIRALSIKLRITDNPDGHRKLQSNSVPLGGGVSLFVSLWIAIGAMFLVSPEWKSILWQSQSSLWALLAATTTVALVGLVDDRFGLRGRHKLLGQCAAAAIVISGGLVIRHVTLFGIDLDLGPLAVPLTLLWLVGAMNALNLIDGVDGVASSIGIILSATIAFMAVWNGHPTTALVMAALVGSLLGFLRYNFPPATMYLGDAGSMLIGLVVGTMSIAASLKGPATVAMIAPVAAMTIPLFDTLVAILRRKLTGRSIYTTDRGHLHHQLLEKSGSTRRTLTWIGLACAMTGIGTLVSVAMKNDAFAIVTSLAVIAILVATRVFGHVELQLLLKNLRNLGASFVSLTNKNAPKDREHSVRLQGSGPWDLLWSSLLESIDKLHLAVIRLDVNVPSVSESYHASWSGTTRRDAQELWRVELPLYAGQHVLGRLVVSGEHDGRSVCEIVECLMDMLLPFESRLLEMAGQKSASSNCSAGSADSTPEPQLPPHEPADKAADDAVESLESGPPLAAPQSPAREVFSAQSPSRVVFLNRSYWPDAEATGQLLTELGEDLAQAGWDVTVVVGQPNQNPEGAEFQPRGTDSRRGVTIVRVWHTRFSKRFLVGRAINFITYLCSAFIATLRLKRMEVLVVQTDPPLLCLLGSFLRRWHRAKLVVYLQDIYPDLAVALGKIPGGFPTRLLRRMMFAVYRGADRVIVLSRDMRELLTRSGVEPDRTTCLPNWVDTELVYPCQEQNSFRAEHELNGKFVVMYSGNMGLCQRLDDVLAAAELLRDEPRILFALIGDGALRSKLYQQVQERQLSNVRFYPYQPKSQLAQSLSAADVHLIPLDPRIAECLMPSKLYGILASGSAILTIAPAACELAEITEQARVGSVVPPGAPEELARVLRAWAIDSTSSAGMGERARSLAVAKYDRSRATARFGELLGEVLNPHSENVPATSIAVSASSQASVETTLASSYKFSPAKAADPVSSPAKQLEVRLLK